MQVLTEYRIKTRDGTGYHAYTLWDGLGQQQLAEVEEYEHWLRNTIELPGYIKVVLSNFVPATLVCAEQTSSLTTRQTLFSVHEETAGLQLRYAVSNAHGVLLGPVQAPKIHLTDEVKFNNALVLEVLNPQLQPIAALMGDWDKQNYRLMDASGTPLGSVIKDNANELYWSGDYRLQLNTPPEHEQHFLFLSMVIMLDWMERTWADEE